MKDRPTSELLSNIIGTINMGFDPFTDKDRYNKFVTAFNSYLQIEATNRAMEIDMDTHGVMRSILTSNFMNYSRVIAHYPFAEGDDYEAARHRVSKCLLNAEASKDMLTAIKTDYEEIHERMPDNIRADVEETIGILNTYINDPCNIPEPVDGEIIYPTDISYEYG